MVFSTARQNFSFYPSTIFHRPGFTRPTSFVTSGVENGAAAGKTPSGVVLLMYFGEPEAEIFSGG
ncbi:hypothetical protein J2Z49_002471 [Desulfofundulus luciae]|uniref:Uncharacterized protein n=1 Tax=Desulfofundulus luciae TaxID=74702 RepID=A0ABU0B502_9FIRM|nr:hypothetical protein [Desulfofundulus luciae]